jgi:hypothetical protein
MSLKHFVFVPLLAQSLSEIHPTQCPVVVSQISYRFAQFVPPASTVQAGMHWVEPHTLPALQSMSDRQPQLPVGPQNAPLALPWHCVLLTQGPHVPVATLQNWLGAENVEQSVPPSAHEGKHDLMPPLTVDWQTPS